jgi:myo-inositol-1(or 4)-monophosphatase
MKSVPSNLSQVRQVAEVLAQEAGTLIRQGLVIGQQREWKADQTPVTAVDKDVNQLVIDTIHAQFPDHSILAEEGSDLTRSQEYIWVCDPVDGTFPFMHGIPISTFTLALVHQGQPIFGLIYDPFTERLFVAEKGQGTTLNGKPIKTSTHTTLQNASMGIVLWKGNAEIYLPIVTKLVDVGAKVFQPLSIAYMDALVAAGEFVATIFPGTSAHDSAAAKIIIEEAGGIFTSLIGKDQRYDQPVNGHIAAANSEIYAAMRQILSDKQV